MLCKRDFGSVGEEVNSHQENYINLYLLRIEDYDPKCIEVERKGLLFFAKKISGQGYSNLRSGDLSKFKTVIAKVKMIDNTEKGNNCSPFLGGIYSLKEYKNNTPSLHITKKGIFFFHHPQLHIFYGNKKMGDNIGLKFDSNGESLRIKVDNENDLLSFIDDYENTWNKPLSEIVKEELLCFCFEMFEPNVKVQVQFLFN